MTAPERVWVNVQYPGFCEWEAIASCDYAEYTRSDVSAAMVAAAYEAAARWCETHAVQSVAAIAMPEPVPDEAWANNHQGVKYATRLRALTPADARASLDRMLAEARAEGMRKAAALCSGWDGHDYRAGCGCTSCGIADAILEAAAALSPKPVDDRIAPDDGRKGE